MMLRPASQTIGHAVEFFLTQSHAFAYNSYQQHPPRLSTMRTMGGYFFPGAGKW